MLVLISVVVVMLAWRCYLRDVTLADCLAFGLIRLLYELADYFARSARSEPKDASITTTPVEVLISGEQIYALHRH